MTEFPAPHPHVSLVLRFSASMGEAGNHQVEIVLRDPDGKEMMRLNGDLQVGPGPAMSGGEVRVPQVLNIERLVFPKAGLSAPRRPWDRGWAAPGPSLTMEGESLFLSRIRVYPLKGAAENSGPNSGVGGEDLLWAECGLFQKG